MLHLSPNICFLYATVGNETFFVLISLTCELSFKGLDRNFFSNLEWQNKRVYKAQHQKIIKEKIQKIISDLQTINYRFENYRRKYGFCKPCT